MPKLIYASNVSLDGFTEDQQGRVDWAPPDDAVFGLATDLMRSAGTYLYGRRMYESMAVWETEPALAAQSDLTRKFAEVWQTANKVVYSTTLTGSRRCRPTRVSISSSSTSADSATASFISTTAAGSRLA